MYLFRLPIVFVGNKSWPGQQCQLVRALHLRRSNLALFSSTAAAFSFFFGWISQQFFLDFLTQFFGFPVPTCQPPHLRGSNLALFSPQLLLLLSFLFRIFPNQLFCNLVWHIPLVLVLLVVVVAVLAALFLFLHFSKPALVQLVWHISIRLMHSLQKANQINEYLT